MKTCSFRYLKERRAVHLPVWERQPNAGQSEAESLELSIVSGLPLGEKSARPSD